MAYDNGALLPIAACLPKLSIAVITCRFVYTISSCLLDAHSTLHAHQQSHVNDTKPLVNFLLTQYLHNVLKVNVFSEIE